MEHFVLQLLPNYLLHEVRTRQYLCKHDSQCSVRKHRLRCFRTAAERHWNQDVLYCLIDYRINRRFPSGNNACNWPCGGFIRADLQIRYLMVLQQLLPGNALAIPSSLACQNVRHLSLVGQFCHSPGSTASRSWTPVADDCVHANLHRHPDHLHANQYKSTLLMN